PIPSRPMTIKFKTLSVALMATLMPTLMATLMATAMGIVALWCQSCGGRSTDPNRPTLILGAFTAPREAYGNAIIPAFKTYWKEKTGQAAEFQESYQGSGAQSRAIVGGFEADIASLSLEQDITRIAEAGLITHDWQQSPNHGISSNSIVVIA